jgi:hypothetical protein
MLDLNSGCPFYVLHIENTQNCNETTASMGMS